MRSGAHPDLTWVVPSGAHEILVSDIDEPVVAAASRTPFESSRRVFVIERVDELGDEAANRMLKTLEEPASFVHLILLTDRLDRGAADDQLALSAGALRRSAHRPARRRDSGIGRGAPRPHWRVRALSLGDLERARELAGEEGGASRAAAERFARAALAGEAAATQRRGSRSSPRSGSGARPCERSSSAKRRPNWSCYPRKERKRVETEWTERIRRARRRAETGALDLALQMVALWYADLAALAWGAEELVRNPDRLDELRADGGRDPRRLMAAVELVEETRRRFQLNVSEELACEALAYRLEEELAG